MVNLCSNLWKLFHLFLSMIIVTIVITYFKMASNSIETCLTSKPCNASDIFCTAITSCTASGISQLLNTSKVGISSSLKILHLLKSNTTSSDVSNLLNSSTTEILNFLNGSNPKIHNLLNISNDELVNALNYSLSDMYNTLNNSDVELKISLNISNITDPLNLTSSTNVSNAELSILSNNVDAQNSSLLNKSNTLLESKWSNNTNFQKISNKIKTIQ